jgi:tetratricopeptide (TPR) repeat protein
MLRFRCVLIVLAAAIAGGSPSAAEFVGEEPVAVRNAIGDGMHAYHAGDYDRAYDDLTNAIEAGTEDPRAYYFRGLAALRLGRTSEAEADFTTGADRELVTGSMRRASQSLERVQGTDRLSLERFRARARLGQLQREREHYGRRYSTIEDASGDVRRRRRPEDIRPELVAPRGRAMEDLPAAGVEEVPAPAGKAASPAKPGKKVMDEPAEMDEPAAESDDPFSDEPAPGKRMSKNKAAAKDVMDEDTAVEDDNAAAGQ